MPRRLLPFVASIPAIALQASIVLAQDLPRGQIVDEVSCAGDPTQSYALYLPSNYSPDRAWSLLVAFHPAARGRAMVETYRAAAEKYGYVVAGSNNSRNGPWEVAAASVRAMSADLGERFSIDADRFYLTGLSGGARVALQVALGTKKIAGVIASSAGYPDSKPRKSLPFVIFGTAGTEDFNYIELRMLDRVLTTPHRLAIFEGGHTLPPDHVALDAIEWLELQAMKSGRKTRDEALIDQLLQILILTFRAGLGAIPVYGHYAFSAHNLEDPEAAPVSRVPDTGHNSCTRTRRSSTDPCGAMWRQAVQYGHQPARAAALDRRTSVPQSAKVRSRNFSATRASAPRSETQVNTAHS